MPLFVNQSPVSERENVKNPWRERRQEGREEGLWWKAQQKRRVPPSPSANHVASLVGGSWGSKNTLELQGKNTKRI